MSELEKIRAIIDGAENEALRAELEEAERVLMDTFSDMLGEARAALLGRLGTRPCFDDAHRAMEKICCHAGDIQIEMPENRRALIYYIAQLGREALELL